MPVRELVALVFTDIVDSTRTAHVLGDRVWNDVRRRHFDLTAKIARRHGGTEVKDLGDGLMLAFSGASGALAATAEIQQAVHADHRRWLIEQISAAVLLEPTRPTVLAP